MPRGHKPLGEFAMTRAEIAARHLAKYGRDYVNERRKAWRKANPEKEKKQKRRDHLKANYGLTEEVYEALWLSQDKKCAICGSDDPRAKKGWQIDHCHSTDRIRGILCASCNLMLACARDNLDTLNKGIEYLKNKMD